MKDKVIDIIEDVLYEHGATEVDATFSINVPEREIANLIATRIEAFNKWKEHSVGVGEYKQLKDQKGLPEALKEFRNKFPSVTSGDLQTFVLGYNAAISKAALKELKNG